MAPNANLANLVPRVYSAFKMAAGRVDPDNEVVFWHLTCLVPSPLYFAAVNSLRVMWSKRKSEAFPGRSVSDTSHQNELNVKAFFYFVWKIN